MAVDVHRSSMAFRFRSLLAATALLSTTHCKRTTSTTTPTLVATADAHATTAPIDAQASLRAAPLVESSLDAGSTDASDAAAGRPVRWMPTRTWQPTATIDRDATADGSSPTRAAQTRAEPAQLVLTDDGPIGISTDWNEADRRHPVVVRRFSADGVGADRIAIVAQYTGDFVEVAASARGSTLWVLWRADGEQATGNLDAKHLAVSVQPDLSRASNPIMVRQRGRRGEDHPMALLAIEAREDGGAWAYVGLGLRPAPDVDPIYRTSPEDVFNEFVSEGVDIDPWHRVSSVTRSTEVLNADRCADTGVRALFWRLRDAVFGDYVVDCAPEYSSSAPTMISAANARWSSPAPNLRRATDGTLIVNGDRVFSLNVRQRQFSVQEHSMRLVEPDAGATREPGPSAVTHQQPTVRCEDGQLFLTSNAPSLRLALTGPGASADLASVLTLLGFVRGELRPRTMQWTGTHLLSLSTAAELFAPRLRRWRCADGSLVED